MDGHQVELIVTPADRKKIYDDYSRDEITHLENLTGLDFRMWRKE